MPTTSDVYEFWGCADVRVYRVFFWLDSIKRRPEVEAAKKNALVKISITHEGDSSYYDRTDRVHTFAHDPICPGWSYRLLSTPYQGQNFEVVESGDIVSDRGVTMAYAAPSPFASWTISLHHLDYDKLDLSGITGGRFEFFGTSRAFGV
ncbi:hypothetical protein P170DRAFT_508858 [Aspergillus steynii IBT 23096]|uniref:Uncharacterized protein n=1 Tax=Aspergillus steynii IBT 23096 TaxID=1392250 RepID=A0A2I2GCW9_9EURO|nr:uncharacterized protein P170DRAFT_508858 [Aspergillus steynii IBT 23096]PLB50712.1 hypothetical protein P170DRAFT_508858 [Aspergillus steynii IBT 23096]